MRQTILRQDEAAIAHSVTKGQLFDHIKLSKFFTKQTVEHCEKEKHTSFLEIYCLFYIYSTKGQIEGIYKPYQLHSCSEKQ